MATYDAGALDALSLPLGELIASVGRGIADAQRDLDLASIAAFQEVYESSAEPLRELQRIGYRPNWYHIPEAEGDIQVALTIAGQVEQPASTTATPTPVGPGGVISGTRPLSRAKIYAAPVDAGYASRFNYTIQAASRVRFRIVPVPPSSAAEAVQVMPALIGMTLGEARNRLDALGIDASLPDDADDALVTTQAPTPGSILATDTVATVGIEDVG